ncbi:hypothetical protein GDO81_005100 [Engystomops pustulosus]|uniref:Uncharacterized protein n=1 Tax=Engystomops pustulosus TaxID=76066 RepID=A0AAV7CNC3_ENGPU|nr:hypothetical protein GDO81_005100 [Engystomops pustulosus]
MLCIESRAAFIFCIHLRYLISREYFRFLPGVQSDSTFCEPLRLKSYCYKAIIRLCILSAINSSENPSQQRCHFSMESLEMGITLLVRSKNQPVKMCFQ